MSKTVLVELTVPQVEALLSAVAEVVAGPDDSWNDSTYRALLRARNKLVAAT